MAINPDFNEQDVVEAIAEALESFYASLLLKINEVDLKGVLRNKNPYLFRAKGYSSAADIVEAILSAYVSSSEETVFGNVFFEPIAISVSGGHKALAEGVDIMVDRGDVIYGIAVKSGTKVFNADSRKRQEQNFLAANKLAQQAKKRFVPIIGYGYGRKQSSRRGQPKFYLELAGKAFWQELTGDEEFYIKLIRLMGKLPEKYVEEFNEAYQKASNRLVKQFIDSFCDEEGSIDWERIVRFNSGD